MNAPYSVEKQLGFVKKYWGTEVVPRIQARALQLITLSSTDPHVPRPVDQPQHASIPYQPEIDTLPHPTLPGEDFRPMALIRVGWLGLFSLCKKPHPQTEQPWPTVCAFRYDDQEKGPLPTNKPLPSDPHKHIVFSAMSLDMEFLRRCAENFTQTHSQMDTTLHPWTHAAVTMGHDTKTNTLYPYVTHLAPTIPNAQHRMITSVVLHADAQPGLA